MAIGISDCGTNWQFQYDSLSDNGLAPEILIWCRRAGGTVVDNRSMPHGDVIPVLAYPDVRAAVDWLCRAFGFVERLRIGDHRAQLQVRNGSVVVAARPAGASSSRGDDM